MHHSRAHILEVDALGAAHAAAESPVHALDDAANLEGIESDLTMIRDAQEKAGDVERNGRKELWVEVSALRERLVKIETKMTGEC